jgi:hypothetical protein
MHLIHLGDAEQPLCMLLDVGTWQQPLQAIKTLMQPGIRRRFPEVGDPDLEMHGMCFVPSTDTQCSTPTRVVDESLLMNSSSRSRDSTHGGSRIDADATSCCLL